MATQNTSQLSHDEAFELLPWHVNASLGETLTNQVAGHITGCEICQQESAMLSSAILAINTEEPGYRDIDIRFQNLLGRIREHERRQDVPDELLPKRPFGELLAERLGLSPRRLQWATAFVLGLIVSASAILGSRQLLQQEPVPQSYQVYSEEESAPRLLIQFSEIPSEDTLATLIRNSGPATRWHKRSDTEYAMEFAGDADVQTVSEIRSRLLQNETVHAVEIDGR